MDKKPGRPLPERPARPPKTRNEFGDPARTVYAGGTPLLDERTGRSITKREYLKRPRSSPKP